MEAPCSASSCRRSTETFQGWGTPVRIVPNRLGFRLNDDPREKALRNDLYRRLERTRARAAGNRHLE
jgi:hypothetical protein